MGASGHRAVDHTADLAIELWADDEPALLVEGARAVVERLTDGAVVRPRAQRPITLDALDPEDRLVRWLAEVVYLASSEGFLVHDATLELHDGGLRGTLYGEPDAQQRIRTEIKAVTYHGLQLDRALPELRARVIFDV